MELELKDIGKRYNRKWLFRNINVNLERGDCLSVTGRNGSGKSTFLQVIYGLVQASEGTVLWHGKEDFEYHKVFAYTSPFMELPHEFSLQDIVELYQRTHKLVIGIDEFLNMSEFSLEQANRPLKLFSSGMLQRAKTALCLSAEASVYLLDEPLTNLDKQGEIWYKNCISKMQGKIIVIAGNNPNEYEAANKNIEISN